ncbi:sugar phosphate isomerase/epimerase family protein [Pelagibacterium sp.]|uniref:sugar phosphate isomerase/epimerase family protein n=1 Tax=Pelagibacterium sp. TaxID=1967288 RepID=UPI003C7CBCFF
MAVLNNEIGAHTFSLVWHGRASDCIEELHSEGFRKIQLLVSPPHVEMFHDREAERIRNVLDANGIDLISIDLPASEYNLASPISELAEYSCRAYLELVDFAAKLGSRSITLVAGRRHSLLEAPSGYLEGVFLPSFRRILARAQEQGVRVIVENHPQSLLSTASSIRTLSDEYPDTGVLYDVANAVAVDEDPAEGICILSDVIKVLHLSDAKEKEWRHDPIGDGSINFSEVIDTVKKYQIDCDVVLEIFSKQPVRDLISGREKIVKLMEKA